MKKGNVTILASILAIALVAAGVGAGTVAYFSDVATLGGHTFTAGNADIMISTDGVTWEHSLSNGWTLDKMVPGDTFTVDLYIKNTGNVPIKALICDLDITEADGDNDGEHLGDYFYMEDDKVRFYANDGSGGVGDPITRWGHWHIWQSTWEGRNIRQEAIELNGVYPDDEIFYWTGMPDGTFDPISPCMNKGVLEPGEIVRLWYEFSFRETEVEQNDAEGDSLSIIYTVEARTNSYDGSD